MTAIDHLKKLIEIIDDWGNAPLDEPRSSQSSHRRSQRSGLVPQYDQRTSTRDPKEYPPRTRSKAAGSKRIHRRGQLVSPPLGRNAQDLRLLLLSGGARLLLQAIRHDFGTLHQLRSRSICLLGPLGLTRRDQSQNRAQLGVRQVDREIGVSIHGSKRSFHGNETIHDRR